MGRRCKEVLIPLYFVRRTTSRRGLVSWICCIAVVALAWGVCCCLHNHDESKVLNRATSAAPHSGECDDVEPGARVCCFESRRNDDECRPCTRYQIVANSRRKNREEEHQIRVPEPTPTGIAHFQSAPAHRGRPMMHDPDSSTLRALRTTVLLI